MHEPVPGGCPGRHQRLLVAAQAVIQNGGDPVRPRHRGSLSRGRGLLEGGLDQRDGLGLAAPEGSQHQGGGGNQARPGGLAGGVGFCDQRSGGRKVTPPCGGHGPYGQQDRELIERADISSELDRPFDQVIAFVIPQRQARHGGPPAPPEPFCHRDVRVGKGADGLAQHRGGGGRTVGDQQSKTVQQQVGRLRRAFWRGQCPGGAGDLLQVAGIGQVPGEQRRLPGVQVRLTGQARIERLQPPGRLE
jgi:hypothetical protein